MIKSDKSILILMLLSLLLVSCADDEDGNLSEVFNDALQKSIV